MARRALSARFLTATVYESRTSMIRHTIGSGRPSNSTQSVLTSGSGVSSIIRHTVAEETILCYSVCPYTALRGLKHKTLYNDPGRPSLSNLSAGIGKARQAALRSPVLEKMPTA